MTSSPAPDVATALRALPGVLRARGREGAGDLAALMPCRITAGVVAVAVWTSPAGHIYELVAIDGATLDDPTALREAVQVLAVDETVSELAAPELLESPLDVLRTWPARHAGSLADDQAFAGAFERAATVLSELAAAVSSERDPEEANLPSAERLDRLGGLFAALAAAWSPLEQQAERWMREQARADDTEAAQQLWSALAAGRRGPLSVPMASAVESGSRAGLALADEIAPLG